MAKVLVVDDDALSRELLVALLEPEGHEVMEAGTGEDALALALDNPPDIVLCDVILPGIHGFDVALQLKAQVTDDFLPIVLLTSLTDNTSRMLGLRKGADDFLTKPVNGIELKIRVMHLLNLREQGRSLRMSNIALLEATRYREEMVNLIVHDLKNPLAVILANLEYIADSPDALDEASLEALKDSQSASNRMMRLLANLLDVARIEVQRLDLRRGATDLSALLHNLATQRTRLARVRGFELTTSIAPEIRIEADPDLLSRVLENLLDNAARHTPRGGRMDISVVVGEPHVRIFIGNSGSPIPLEVRAAIFEKYGQSSSGKHGRMNLGLGLYFCRLATEAHGGRIWVEEQPTLPAVFAIELPIAGTTTTAATID